MFNVGVMLWNNLLEDLRTSQHSCVFSKKYKSPIIERHTLILNICGITNDQKNMKTVKGQTK